MWNEMQQALIEETALQSLPLGNNPQYRQDVWGELKKNEGKVDVPELLRGTLNRGFRLTPDLSDKCRAVYSVQYRQALQPGLGRLAVWKDQPSRWHSGNDGLMLTLVEEFTLTSSDTHRVLHMPSATYGYLKRINRYYTSMHYVGKMQAGDAESGALETFLALYQPYGEGAMRDPKKALQAARDIHRN